MFRPGGYSSSEDEDEFDFSSDVITNAPPPKVSAPTPADKLTNAIIQGNITEVQCLLTEVPINESLKGGWSALIFAAANGHVDIVEFLLKQGADPNFSKDQFTALMASCRIKGQEQLSLKCVKLLVENGADCKARDSHRTTPLMFASSEGHTLVVKYLLPFSDINAQDNRGWSALFWAIDNSKVEVVELLIKSGALTDTLDYRRRTPLDIAETRRSEKIIDLLGGYENVPEVQENFDANVRKSFLDLYMEAKDESHSLKNEVASFLISLHLEKFISVFENHNIDLITLLTISEAQLKEMGIIATRHRQKILKAIKTFHLEPWKKSSVVTKPLDDVFTVHDGVVVLCGTLRQLDLLRASVLYMRQRLGEVTLDKENGKNVETLRHYVKNALLYAELLQKESYYLLCQAKKIEVTDPVVPADLIVEKKKKVFSKKLKTIMVTFAIIVSMALYRFR